MKPTHVTFYQGLGALLLVADVALVALALIAAGPIDKFVLGALTLPLIGAIALMRPQILDRGVRAAVRRVGGSDA